MDMISAAKATVELARRAGMDNLSSDMEELDYPHLVEMISKMETMDMSEGKLGRWLGWIQCAVVAAQIEHPDHSRIIGLEDMKEINREYAD